LRSFSRKIQPRKESLLHGEAEISESLLKVWISAAGVMVQFTQFSGEVDPIWSAQILEHHLGSLASAQLEKSDPMQTAGRANPSC